MDEKQEPIEKFYTHLTKLQHKINKHIKTIEHILQNHSQSDQELDEDNLVEVEQHRQQIKKQIKKIKKQIDNALYEFQINSANSNQLGVRYDILRESRKQLFKNNNQLKIMLQNGREKLKKLKRLQNNLNSLQNQHKLEKTSVNKLQLAYNNSLKLQKQIVQRVQEIERRQHNLQFELQKQRDKNIKNSEYWKNRQKYDKLVTHKNTIHKHIQSRIQQGNKNYKNKFNQLDTLTNKINSYHDIYQQLQVNTNQQNFIIKQIMMRQNLTIPQLLQQANIQYGDQFLFQDNLHKLKNQQYLSNQIKKLRKKVGRQDNSYEKYSSTGRRKRMYTDGVESLKQQSKKKQKIKTQGFENGQNHLRMTTKIKLNKPKYSLNINSIKSMEIYPDKIKKLQISNKTSQIKINNTNFKQRKNINQSQIQNIQNKQIYQNQGQNLLPITHDKISSFSTPKTINSKFTSRNSQNIRVNYPTNQKQHPSSDYGTDKKQKISDLELNFRVRTKQGYVYKTKKLNPFHSQQASNDDDLSSNNSSYFKQKSQIIQLYDKLSRQDIEKNKKNGKKIPDMSDCICSDKNSEGNRNHSNDSLFNQSESSFGEVSSYVKLKSNNRKKGRQGNKQIMQSRQSDSEKMEKKQKLKNSHIKIDNIKKQEAQSNKNEDFQSKCQQIRKRLKTIHEKQQEILNRGNSP